VHFLRDTVGGRTVAELIGQGQQDPATAAAVRDAWITPRRRRARLRIDAAQARGEVRADLDGDLVLDLLYGPVYYRHLLGHGELSDDLAEQLVDAALRGVSGTARPE
ncbi:MAG: TetR/AcrR family transcriptional regulator C-terminal ligand-binding domain-containing protein, partial [Actinobacteria bacterium]|nr:TetR/AcrR family transcriptional regulator C-terminal ligand-binding domain-containing protein [Actinomycetota bacterium]